MASCRASCGWNIQVRCTISLRQAYGSTGVMSRGDRYENIYLDDVDRQDFLKTLAEACQKAGWQVHAYCLMRNHYHVVLETPNANLVAGMAWLQSTYTIRLNHRHRLFVQVSVLNGP